MNNNYFDYNKLEIAICLEDKYITEDDRYGKFYIPIFTPFLVKDYPYDIKKPSISTKNIISDKTGLNIDSCTESNYILIKIPESMNITKINKNDQFIISFISGNINNPYIIGRR